MKAPGTDVRVRIARFVLRHRGPFSLAIALVTVFFALQVPKVTVESRLIDLFPETHEFVETYKEFQDVFGGANVVVLSVEVTEGDIYNVETLEKVRRLTKELEVFDGINNYQVLSLAQRKVKDITVDPVAGFQAVPVMWPEVPKTPEEIEALRNLVRRIPRLHGVLVSRDETAALVVAGFFEGQFDPLKTYRKLQELARSLEDDHTRVRMIGRPVLLGHILQHYPTLAWWLGLTLFSMVLLLALYFRDFRGVWIPFATAVLSAIWGLGLLGLLGHNFDPLILVIPFVISARALSHSVQLIERFLEEYGRDGDRREAAARTCSALMEPGVISIVTDALGVGAVWLTPIPLMQKMAVMGSFWVMSLIVTDVLLNPVLLSWLPPPRKRTVRAEGWLSRGLVRVGTACLDRPWRVIGVTALLLVVGVAGASRLVIGDVHPGTPMLWPDSSYNLDNEAIGAKFQNTEVLSVIVEGDAWNAIKSPDVLTKMAMLQREMASMPEVGGTSSIADLVPPLIRAMHGGDPRWELIPTDGRESGFFLEMIYGASEPGDLQRFITPDSRHANIAIYLKDHRGETLRAVEDRLRTFVDQNPMDHARFRLAGGFGGLLAAVNDVIVRTEGLVTLLAFGTVFLFCWLAYRSLLAGVLFLVPLVLSNYLTLSLMGIRRIGLDVNVLPVISLGVGLGVDYGLYVVSRIQEEFQVLGDLRSAILRAIATSGKAVFFTAATMTVSTAFWGFSFLRFQADMGVLLVFWLAISMLGGLVLLPALIHVIRPAFVIGRR